MSPPHDAFASAELTRGEVLAGKYLLLEPLAVGGMGQVWSAQNLATGATVAAKVLLPDHATSSSCVARFRREAEATATLSHRAIVRIFDLVEIDPERGSLVLIMELLRGHTLAYRLEQGGPLSVAETLSTIFPLLSAIAHAHGLGIVHRDIKPDNVFLALDPDGQVMPKIVDFGVSKHVRGSPITLDGQTVGTPSYMSPEQTMGASVDPRSDIFSLGILLYECLSGRNPFFARLAGSTQPFDFMSVFDVEPEPIDDIPPALWDVIHRALARRAEDRFANVEELATALRAAAPSGVITPDPRASAVPGSPFEAVLTPVPAAPRLRYRAAVFALCAAVGVVMLAPARLMATPHAVRHPIATQRAPNGPQKYAVAGTDRLRAAEPTEVDAPRPKDADAAKPASTAESWITLRASQERSKQNRKRLALGGGAGGVVRDPGF